MRNGIKKYVITSIPILFGCLFGISNGVEITESCVRYANSNYNCYEVEPGESYTLKGYDLTITNDLNFTSDDIQGILLTKYTSSSSKNYTTSVFWNGTGLYHSEGHEGNGGTAIWIYSGAYVSDSTNYTGVVNSLANQTPSIQPIGDILQTINGNGVSRIVYMLRDDFQAYPYYCFIYDDIDYSFCIQNDPNLGGLNDSVRAKYLEKKTGANYYNTPSELVSYLSTTYGISESPIIVGPTEPQPETTPILGDCPTIREILSTYGSDYNTGICYSATRLLTQTGIVTATAQSIFELYPTFTDRLQDYNYYKQYCDNVPTTVCREAFSGNEIKRSLLNKTPQDNPISIYQYCHLQLNIPDKNATTCVLSTGAYFATGVDQAIEEEIQGNQSVLDIMLNSFNNLKEELPSFSSGTVFDEFLEEGETRKNGFKLDIFKTFLELWSKITSIFIFRHQYEGIIPTYITSIIMIILLFKILKK